MSDQAYKNIINMTRYLTREELLRLSNEVKAMAQFSKESAVVNDRLQSNESNSSENFVLGVLYDVLKEMGIGIYYRQLQQEGAKGETKEKIKAVQSFLDSMGKPTRAKQTVILKLSIRMLVENLRNRGMPVTPAVVLRQMHLLPSVLDRHFPGYVQFGLLGKVIGD